jgi:amino acid transporter/nucleotide-binding universal stress UspA family protein
MLYGDWGTSRFYVLGLAFYFALFSSFYYIVGVGLLVAAVGWAYTVVCRAYPDGGGVYSAARQISPILSVVGALMLFANYAVTAAISAFDGMHYFGLQAGMPVALGAAAAIFILCIVNYIGPRHAGALALVIALATLLLTIILACFAIPHLPTGWHAIQRPTETISHRWVTLVSVVLALSGVEVIANMTGIMVQPVEKTAKKSIWPVLAEVVIFNILLGIAMLALPAMLHAKEGKGHPKEFTQAAHLHDELRAEFARQHPDYLSNPDRKAEYNLLPHKTSNEERMQTVVMRVMAEEFVGDWFGKICGFVFGMLLLSAVNTVIAGMVSVSYVMARDRELPHFFTKLNLFGVPWAGLVPALVVPIILLMMFHNLELLADLYAIGVVGAIGINLSCCTINRKLNVRLYERLAIGAIAAVMVAMELTLAVEKPHALFFVGIILVAGLSMRFFTKSYLPRRAAAKARAAAEAARARAAAGETAVEEKPEIALYGTPAEKLDMSRPHIMVATRGGQRLLDFAASYVKQIGGILFVLYVRQLNVQFAPVDEGPTLDEDAEARNVFQAAAAACKKHDVPMVPIYVVSKDVPYSILDFAATYDVRALLMGVSRQGTLLRALRGDVLTAVADQLPQDIPLLIHA